MMMKKKKEVEVEEKCVPGTLRENIQEQEEVKVEKEEEEEEEEEEKKKHPAVVLLEL